VSILRSIATGEEKLMADRKKGFVPYIHHYTDTSTGWSRSPLAGDQREMRPWRCGTCNEFLVEVEYPPRIALSRRCRKGHENTLIPLVDPTDST
jgi:hypothetical protein